LNYHTISSVLLTIHFFPSLSPPDNAQSSAVAPVADPVERIEAEEPVKVEKKRLEKKRVEERRG
jgi:hypothetical protein